MKKGFTLIELLAVIVILAIIALIATPIVLNIINDTKESSVLRSADFYLDALENEIMLENMKQGGSFNPDVCSVNRGKVSCEGKELTIKVDGERPTSGSITFSDGKVVSVNLTYTNGTITLNKKGELVLGETTETPVCTLVENGDVAPTGISAGDKYRCKVKDDMEPGFEDGYYFFVLGTNSDGTTNLIMDRNIYYDSTNDVGLVATSSNTGLVAWVSKADYNDDGRYGEIGFSNKGPITAMNYLYNSTKDWDNVPNIVVNYTNYDIVYDYGYGTIITTNNITKITKPDGTVVTVLTDKKGYTNLKARMPIVDEVRGEGKCTRASGSCPLWLANHLKNSNDEELSGITGYWTLSAPGDSPYYAWSVIYNGYDGYFVSDDSINGIRPVITLPTGEL